MTLHIERLEKDIILVNYIGGLNLVEHRTEYKKTIVPACEENEPDPTHVIHNVTQLEMGFTDMLKWIESMQTRRTSELLAPTMRQYWVGNNQWVKSMNTWMKKHDGQTIPVFTEVQQAVDYIKS